MSSFNMDTWWQDRSLPAKIFLGIGFAILAVGLAAAFGWVVMALWNWLMPELFGLKRVSYWQAAGLLALCWILFKNWGSGSGSSKREERKRKQHLRSYMSPAGEDATEAGSAGTEGGSAGTEAEGRA